MELVEIMQSFLPREVVELFEIVKIDDKPSDWRMDIYLDERKVVPNHLHNAPVIAYGFVDAVTIQDFPIRGKRVYLHLRRRKWLNKSDNTFRVHLSRHTTNLGVGCFFKSYELSYERSSITELASEFGILPDRIYSWRKELSDYGSASFPGHGVERLSDEGRRVKELEKKLKTTELELEILKKAIAVLRSILRVRCGYRTSLISIPLMVFAI